MSRHKYPTCFDCLNAGGVRLNSLVYAYLFPIISQVSVIGTDAHCSNPVSVSLLSVRVTLTMLYFLPAGIGH